MTVATRFLWFLSLSALLFVARPAVQAQVIDGGVIQSTVQAGTKPVAIVSSNADVAGLLEVAFSTHGGFRVVKPGEGVFTFVVTPAGSNAVQLQIKSGRPAVTQLTETVRGNSLADAALRAGDLAVLRTTGKPGFFAGKLAFVGANGKKQEVYTSDLFFRNTKRLTGDNSYSQHPRWSPDGRKLLYTGYYRTGFPDVFMIDLDTGRRVTVAGYKGTNTGAVFSPSGQSIAMVLSSSGSPEVYVAGPDGQRPRLVSQGTTRSVESDPDWSPDGGRLVLTSDQLGGPQLFVVSARGGRPSRLPTNISGYCTEPAWNPVSGMNKIAFTASTRGSYQIALYDLSARKSQFLTSGGGSFSQPRWLNDGRHLVATYAARGQQTLWLIDSETGKKTKLPSGRLTNISQPDFVYPN
ncbi:hypothetical protein [Ruficoccus sp. ZRK36]|uniref:hypothetical protein n=1 Tax=Ruficoccus sp. ZRK36 TaxID=2866311 RepID=UPI001C738FAF|nr:hypothetical protein [Ruficoccus sp. ZRK36]QYY36253.1 hypothetical protein K0V07_02020 [Ruficoccus sp. ZRK36]